MPSSLPPIQQDFHTFQPASVSPSLRGIRLRQSETMSTAASATHVEASIRDWLSKQAKPLVHKHKHKVHLGSKLKSLEGHEGSNLHWDEIVEHGKWSINVIFDPPLSKSMSLEAAQAALSHIAMDSTPMPGFGPHEHWDVYPQVPVSSFKEGVTVTAWDGERMGLHVESHFFALYGRRTDVHPPGCGSMPEGTYVHIRQKFDFVMDVDAPVEI
eukprot:gene12691-15923_t